SIDQWNRGSNQSQPEFEQILDPLRKIAYQLVQQWVIQFSEKAFYICRVTFGSIWISIQRKIYGNITGIECPHEPSFYFNELLSILGVKNWTRKSTVLSLQFYAALPIVNSKSISLRNASIAIAYGSKWDRRT